LATNEYRIALESLSYNPDDWGAYSTVGWGGHSRLTFRL